MSQYIGYIVINCFLVTFIHVVPVRTLYVKTMITIQRGGCRTPIFLFFPQTDRCLIKHKVPAIGEMVKEVTNGAERAYLGHRSL